MRDYCVFESKGPTARPAKSDMPQGYGKTKTLQPITFNAMPLSCRQGSDKLQNCG